MSTFTMDQLCKMREIERARVKRGLPGILAEVQELINRLESGGVAGKADDIRVEKAKQWWDKGVGRELQIVHPDMNIATFDDYLATIPEPDPLPEAWKNRFDRLVLVEGRLPLTVLCRLAGLKFNGTDATFIPFDPAKAQSGVRWMWCQIGHKNRNRRPSDCRNSFPTDEVGLDAFEGVSVYVDDLSVINGHVIDLPSSVHAGSRGNCACLGHWSDGPELSWGFGGDASPDFGSASRGSVLLNP